MAGVSLNQIEGGVQSRVAFAHLQQEIRLSDFPSVKI